MTDLPFILEHGTGTYQFSKNGILVLKLPHGQTFSFNNQRGHLLFPDFKSSLQIPFNVQMFAKTVLKTTTVLNWKWKHFRTKQQE
jgi:hypothetical protein